MEKQGLMQAVTQAGPVPKMFWSLACAWGGGEAGAQTYCSLSNGDSLATAWLERGPCWDGGSQLAAFFQKSFKKEKPCISLQEIEPSFPVCFFFPFLEWTSKHP